MNILTEEGAKKLIDLVVAELKKNNSPQQIPARFGAVRTYSTETNEVIEFFEDAESLNKYEEDPSTTNYNKYVIGTVSLPKGGGEGGGGTTSKRVFRINTRPAEINDTVITDGKFEVQMQVVNSNNNVIIPGFVTIKVSTQRNSGSMEEKGSFELAAVREGSSSYKTVDLSRYLSDGVQDVYLSATAFDGETTLTAFSNITYSTVELVNATDWKDEKAGDTIFLDYRIRGIDGMTLKIKIDDYEVYNQLVNPSGDRPTRVSIPVSSLRSTSTGAHNVDACLVINGKESKHVYSEFFYVKEGETYTGPYLIINDVISEAKPYVDVPMFAYNVFSKNTLGQNKPVDVTVKVMSVDERNTYLNLSLGSITPGITNAVYTGSFDIDSTTKELEVIIKFFADGVANTKTYSVKIDNSENYSPVQMGTGFILNPKTRNNSQDNPQTIWNENNANAIVASTWEGFNMNNDGYVLDDDLKPVLRILAGRKITIDYNPFDGIYSSGMTMEFDVKISGLEDYLAEEEPILMVGSQTDGFCMFPLKAHMLTAMKRDIVTQDIQWQEDERVHIAVNFINNAYGKGKNYARMFINGVINREFIYEMSDTFPSNAKIIIGSPKADIDVYGIRIYTKTGLGYNDIQQDYLAALPTAEAKKNFKNKISILKGIDIDFEKATAAGYNTLRFVSNADVDDNGNSLYLKPNITNEGHNVAIGMVEMMVYNADGTPNNKFCQRITNCKQEGQGTSSMTYWAWNITYKPTDNSKRYTYNNGSWTEDTSVSGDKCYFIFPNGKSNKDAIKGIKNVAKINWASSMQSHKMGWCNLYTDMYWKVIGDSPINKVDGYKTARKSVTQLPFLHFVEDTKGKCTYSSVMTFGPGKYDNECFGTKAPSTYYLTGAEQTPTSMFTSLEGSANDRLLTKRMVPWIKEDVFYYLNRNDDDDEKNETLVYNGESQLDVDKFVKDVYNKNTEDEYEIPKGFTAVAGNNILWQETQDTEFASDDPEDKANFYKCVGGNTIKFFRRAYNFDYEHSYRIEPYTGTYISLQTDSTVDKNTQYWLTANDGGHNKYDLFRYDHINGSWVNAGTKRDSNTSDGYKVLNILTQCKSFDSSFSDSGKTTLELNEAFINARIAHYKDNADFYYHNADCIFDQAFRKFGALKDNWCKNTYESLQPDGKISMDSDDNDTSGDIDNVGRSKCPYYAEEHDKCDEDGTFNPDGESAYWNSSDNVRFNLIEKAFGGELKDMTKSLLNAMSDFGTTIFGCMQSYFFDTQEYLGAAVYNTNARILYEAASLDNDYTPNTPPMVQNLGDHLQSEKEYWKKRCAYIASWCSASDFSNTIVQNNALAFRFSKDGENFVKYNVTAHQAIYPSLGHEGNLMQGKRLLPNATSETLKMTVTQDVNCYLFGINYYTSVGNLTGLPIKNDFNIRGKRLTTIIADGAVDAGNRNEGHSNDSFDPTSITITSSKLKKIELTNLSKLGTFAFGNDTKADKLTKINLSGCNMLQSVGEFNNGVLQELILPKNLTKIVIKNQLLNRLTIEGYDKVTVLKLDNIGTISTFSVLKNIYTTKTVNADADELTELDINFGELEINSSTDLDVILWACKIKKVDLKGTITISDNVPFTFNTKFIIMDRFGNIDSAENQLHLIYKVVQNENIDINIFCNGVADTITKSGTYKFRVLPTSYGSYIDNINNISKVEWSFDGEDYGTVDKNTGELFINKVSNYDSERRLLTCKVTLLDGTIKEGQINLLLYNRDIQLGDYVYADGSYGSGDFSGDREVNRISLSLKTIIGVVIINEKAGTIVNGVELKNDIIEISSLKTYLNIDMWGLGSYISGIVLSDGTSAYDIFKLKNNEGTDQNGIDITQNNIYYFSNDNFVNIDNSNVAGNLFYAPISNENINLGYGNIISVDSNKIYPLGKINTAFIIEHRNKVLAASGYEIPKSDSETTEISSLNTCINNIVKANTDNYRGYYYPIASMCYAYQPTIKIYEVLHEQFKKHNWYMPSTGEAARFMFYYYREPSATTFNALKYAKSNGLINVPTVWGNYIGTCNEVSGNQCFGVSGIGKITSVFATTGLAKNHKQNYALPMCEYKPIN